MRDVKGYVLKKLRCFFEREMFNIVGVLRVFFEKYVFSEIKVF